MRDAGRTLELGRLCFTLGVVLELGDLVGNVFLAVVILGNPAYFILAERLMILLGLELAVALAASTLIIVGIRWFMGGAIQAAAEFERRIQTLEGAVLAREAWLGKEPTRPA